MPKLTEAELARKELQTTIAKAVQLVTMNLSRRMKNEIEPDLLAEFDKQVSAGKPFSFDLADAVADIQSRLLASKGKRLK